MFLVAFAVVVLLATVLVRIAFSPSAAWRNAELQAAMSRFSENLMRARVEWMRQGEPSTMLLPLTDRADTGRTVQVRVSMNHAGWPQASQPGKSGCSELWRILAAGEQLQRELTANFDALHNKCRFFYNGKEVFYFYPERGQVEKL